MNYMETIRFNCTRIRLKDSARAAAVSIQNIEQKGNKKYDNFFFRSCFEAN